MEEALRRSIIVLKTDVLESSMSGWLVDGMAAEDYLLLRGWSYSQHNESGIPRQEEWNTNMLVAVTFCHRLRWSVSG